MTDTLADVLQEARQGLESKFNDLVGELQPQSPADLENLAIEHRSEIVLEITYDTMPIYYYDLFMMAIDDLTLVCETPKEVSDHTPADLLGANVFNRIQESLLAHWQNLIGEAIWSLDEEGQ